MADQIGIVTRTKHKGWARVAIQQGAECSQCLVDPTTRACRRCASGPSVENRAANPVGARPGDLVRVHPASVNFVKGAASVYVLPIVFMLLGAFVLSRTGGSLGWPENTAAIVGGLTGLTLGMVLSMGLDRTGRFGRDWTPTIRQVLVPCKEVGVDIYRSLCEP
jgi:sigma-E factor negative regulatory protein RseC